MPSDTPDLAALARAALEDEKPSLVTEAAAWLRAWAETWEQSGAVLKPSQTPNALVATVLRGLATDMDAGQWGNDDADSTRTREPQLAAGVVALLTEVERLKSLREHECTCPLGDARESISKHAKDCALRVNRLKRIPPGVALDRLARALDHGKENDELCALLLEACDLADEANGDPSSCSYNVMIGERVAELRGRTGDAADLVAQRDSALAEIEQLQHRITNQADRIAAYRAESCLTPVEHTRRYITACDQRDKALGEVAELRRALALRGEK